MAAISLTARSLRSRIALSILLPALISLALGGGVALLGVRGAERAAQRRDLRRAESLVRSVGLERSPKLIGQVASFLGCELFILGAGRVIGSSGSRDQWSAIEAGLVRAKGSEPQSFRVGDLNIIGRPRASSGVQVALGFRQGSSSLGPTGLLLGLFALILLGASGAALLTTRSVVAPVERLAELARRWQSAPGQLDVEELKLAGCEEIEELGAALAGMVKSVAEARNEAARNERLAALGKLASSLAHELRNPLAAIQLGLKLELERSEGRSAATLERAIVELGRIELSTGKLLAYGRGPRIEPRETSLQELTASVLSLLEHQLSHLGIRTEIQGAAPPASADPDALRHVLVNLILNAADAMPGGGCIELRLGETDAGMVLFECSDRGPGLPDAAIFEAFTTTKEGGTGLGLAVSLSIAEAHDGGLEASNREGGGAILTLTLPPHESGSRS